MRWFGRPLLHFVLIGGLLYAGRGWLDGRSAPRAGIVVTERALERLRAEFAARTGAEPTPAEEEAIVAAAIDEELLYREARALGLDRNDRSIRHYLADKVRFLGDESGADDAALARQAIDWGLDRGDLVVRRMLIDKMRLVASRAAVDGEASEGELEAFLARHADRYRQPARVSITQVFFRGTEGEIRSRAGDVRRRLERAPLREEEIAALGDPFPLGARFRARTESDLAKLFGPAFAARVMRLEVGVWSEEIASPLGLHLVRVDEQRPALLPALREVRSRVALAVAEERRSNRLREFLDRLRSETPLRVVRADGSGSSGAEIALQAAERVTE